VTLTHPTCCHHELACAAASSLGYRRRCAIRRPALLAAFGWRWPSPHACILACVCRSPCGPTLARSAHPVNSLRQRCGRRKKSAPSCSFALILLLVLLYRCLDGLLGLMLVPF